MLKKIFFFKCSEDLGDITSENNVVLDFLLRQNSVTLVAVVMVMLSGDHCTSFFR